MGILEGKNILVTGVTMNTSIAYAVADIAQKEGANVVVSAAGRAVSLARRVAGRESRGGSPAVADTQVDAHR